MMHFYFILLIINQIIFTNCYTYLSTLEAYIISKNTLCIGDCLKQAGEKRCVYDYNGHETQCRATLLTTKKYMTINNKPCFSNCGYFENESYQWCVTRNDDDTQWDYCNRLIALKGKETFRTNNKYVTCSDQCGRRGKSYNWCYTIKGNWDYCDPENKVVLFNHRTEDNTLCAGPCELYKDDLAYCYDANYDWKKCYVNPEYKYQLNKISLNMKDHHNPGEYTKNGFKLCKRIKKRDLSFTSPLNVEEVAREYENNNPTVHLRDLDPANIITTEEDPVLSYTVLPTYSYFGNDQINLPLAVRAIITSHTLRNPGERETFTSAINRHFDHMHPNLNHVNYDERGHIIGSRLGGPTETYNIFPQSWVHNRGRFSRWQYMESDLDLFLRNQPNRYVEYTAVLSYETDSQGALDYRPTAIALRVRAYDHGRLVDLHGNAVASYNTNILENMYFTNNPDYSCIIEGDEVEDNFD